MVPALVRLPAMVRALLGMTALLTVATCTDAPSTPVGPDKAQEAAPGETKPIALAVAEVPATAVVVVGAGNIARCDKSFDEQTATLLDGLPGTVMALGDYTYGNASLTDFQNCYGPSWGRHKARTRPTPGEGDYANANAGGYFSYFGAAAGDPSKGYYSYDAGAWHVVVLDSEIDAATGSPQDLWLRADLEATAKSCVLAYWHYPRFSSFSTYLNGAVLPFWEALYAARADVVVSAHRRLYERFAPQTPNGGADAKLGLRQFIVGTGGQGLDGTGGVAPRPNSEKIVTGHYGVLRLTLDEYTYRWEFVSTEGQVIDTGQGVCHGRPGGPPVPNQAPTANAGGPYTAEATVTFDGSGSSDIDADLPVTYAWNFGDGTMGTGVSPTKTYGAEGIYTATLVVTDAKGLASAPATATVTITNQPPVVNAGTDATIQVTDGFTLGGTFTDAGGAVDGPWTWTVAWGDGTSSSGTANAQGAVTPSHTYASWGEYTAQLTVRDRNGAPGSDDVLVVVRDPNAVATLVGAGDIAGCDPRAGDELTANLLDGIPGTVITLGDNAYVDATLADFQNCYHPSWGRHRARTKPVPGNHEYEVAAVYTANGYFDYFGTLAGDRDKGYYSYTAGEWLVIALNSASGSHTRSATSPQVQWLKALLASTTRECVMAYMHHPQFTSAQGRHNGEWNVIDLWNALYEGGVELVVTAHDHLYDRFAPMRPDGTLDAQYGIRQITVGTGGFFLYNFGTIHPNSQVRSKASYGVVKLTLRAGSYDWEFVPVAGTFRDQGTGSCHGRPGSTPAPNQPPTASAGGPYTADNTISFAGSGTDPDGNLPLTYAWTFHDGSTSTLANPTRTYATNGSFTATLRVKDALGLESAPATATVTIANVAPTVNAGAEAAVQAGTLFTLNATFTDPGGAADAPWSWSIVWGDGSPAASGATSTLGGPIAPTHTFAAAGSYTVQVTVIDKDGGSHTDNVVVTATATPLNSLPTVSAGADADAVVGSPFPMNATFSDADGTGDGPWAWTIQWGDGATTNGTASTHGGPISASHAYLAAGAFTARLTVTDKNGGAGSDEVVVTVAPAAGPMVLVGAGNIARCDRQFDEQTALLLDGIPGTVLAFGDFTYGTGSVSDFETCYGPSWGRHAARTRPAVGEGDYTFPGAGGYFSYFGASAGDPTKGYYSYDLGSWHIVVLNSSTSMATGSPQEQWLKADLAATSKQCILAYWHFTRFSSFSTYKRSEVLPLWEALYAATADVVVNAHYRLYERFAPQNPSGIADAAGGIRQFTVGTGGQGLDGTGGVTPRANSQAIVTGKYGVLKLTLDSASYSWAFVSTTGETLDSGTTACH